MAMMTVDSPAPNAAMSSNATARTPPSGEERKKRATTIDAERLLVADAGIEPAVADVDHQVDEDEDDAVEQHEVLDEHPVALGDGEHQREAEPGDAEGALDRHRAAQERAQRRPRHGQDGQHGVDQRVAPHDDALAQSLGPGGA